MTLGAWCEQLDQDLRYGLRLLRRDAGLSLGIVLILAVALGLATAIWSFADKSLLRPLPFEDAGRLVWVRGADTRLGLPRLPVSHPDFSDWRERSRSLDDLAAWRHEMRIRSDGELRERMRVGAASPNLYPLLGTTAYLGALPQSETDVVLTYAYWNARFGADPDVIGSSLRLDDHSFTIVGVLGERFAFPPIPAGYGPEAWLSLDHSLDPAARNDRGARGLWTVGRLAPGADLDESLTEMNAIARDLERVPRDEPGDRRQHGPARAPLGRWAPHRVAGHSPGRGVGPAHGLQQRGRSSRQPCAAAADRVRGASGAGRRQGAARPADRRRGRTALHRRHGRGPRPRPRVPATAGAAVLAGRRVPQRHPADRHPRLRGHGGRRRRNRPDDFARPHRRRETGPWRRVRHHGSRRRAPALRLAQGHAGRSGGRLDGGRLRRRPADREPPERGRRAGGLRHGESAGLAGRSTGGAQGPARSHRRRSPPDRGARRPRRPGWLRRVGGLRPLRQPRPGPLLRDRGAAKRGRESTSAGRLPAGEPRLLRRPRHSLASRPTAACAIRRHAAGRQPDFRRPALRDEDPVGAGLNLLSELQQGVDRSQVTAATIVGVVGDEKTWRLDQQRSPRMYANIEAEPPMGFDLMVRASDLEGARERLTAELAPVLPGAPIDRARRIEASARATVWGRWVAAVVMDLFSSLALVLMMIGVYGMLSSAVQERRRELAIRTALGARPFALVGLVVRDALLIATAGVALGVAGSLAAGRFLANHVYTVSPTDPVTMAAAGALLVLLAVVAAWFPRAEPAGPSRLSSCAKCR